MAANGTKVAVMAAFMANGIIAIAKFIAAFITGSAATMSEAFHSVADTGNQGLLLHGMSASQKPADPDHPFGRGKESYFWSFMVAVMLFVGGAVLSIQQGIGALTRDEAHHGSLTLSLIVLSLALVVEGISLVLAGREGSRIKGSRGWWSWIRRSKNSPLVVVLLEDAAACIGLLVALAGTILTTVTDNSLYDGLASLTIGVLLAGVAVVMAIETKALLIGEAARRRDRATIRGNLLGMPEVSSVGRLLTMQFGPDQILINVEIELADSLPTSEAEQVIVRAEALIRESLPTAGDIFVELRDPNAEAEQGDSKQPLPSEDGDKTVDHSSS